MCKHQEKHCPRCQLVFECKPGSVLLCQCSAVQLSVEERAYVEARYDDCLCIDCLRDLQKKYEHFKAKYIFKK